MISSQNQRNLYPEKIYSVFELRKWEGDDIILAPYNFKGLRIHVQISNCVDRKSIDRCTKVLNDYLLHLGLQL